MKRGRLEPLNASCTEPVRAAAPSGIFTGHHAEPGGTTHATGGVTLSKACSFCGKPVNVGRFVKRVRIACSDVHRTEVVGEKNDDVRSLLRLAGNADATDGEDKQA